MYSPWHGACFQVCSGDIEDAPAPDALHTFKTEIRDGKIFVTAEPKYTTKDGKSRPPTLTRPSAAAASEPAVVIVGGGSGGLFTVESLREVSACNEFRNLYSINDMAVLQHGYQGSITLLSKEEHAPIDRYDILDT